MKRSSFIILALLVCFGLIGCGGSAGAFSEYDWGKTLQKTLDKIGVEEVADVEEDKATDETVFVEFTADGDKELSAYMSKDDEKWKTVSVCDADPDSDVCYFSTLKSDKVNDYKTGATIQFGEKKDNTQTEGNTNNSSSSNQEPSKPTITIGQSNALSKAHDYLSVMPFSHQGLIDQLVFEGFTQEDSTYAADNCGADWNTQAAKKAQDYLDIGSYSRQGLIDQLVYEGFTQEQATYGVSAVGY